MSRSKANHSGSATISDPKSEAEDIIINKKENDHGKTIVRSLRKIMQLLDMHSRLLLKEYDLTIPQVMCLYEVFEKRSMTVAALADNIHIGSSTLIGIIDRLAEKRFVKRVRNSDDRRLVFVNITAKGHQFVADTPYLLHNRLRDSLNGLAKNRQVSIVDALNTIEKLLKYRGTCYE